MAEPTASPPDPGFGERLIEAVAAHGPLCAGIDPMPALLERWGLPDDPSGLAAFCSGTLEAFVGTVGVIKPQVAFFERHGSAGFAVLEELVAEARRSGLLVIGDAKRADIGSTAQGYADAWLGDGPLGVDAVTAVAYLGLGALEPLAEAARAHGRGLIVVVRSSNPEGRGLQESVDRQGLSVEDALMAELARANAAERAAGRRLGSLGAVVGVTQGPWRLPLGEFGGPILAPGVGAQGATPADVGAVFGDCAAGSVVVNASRSLLEAGPRPPALRAAAEALREELAAALA